MTTDVRTLGAGEVVSCRAVIEAAFVPYLARLERDFSPQAFDRLPDLVGRGWTLGIDVDGRLAAVAVTCAVPGGWEVDWLAVHPAQQGRGLASRLLVALEARARKAGVRALQLQTAAIMDHLLRFYACHGFIELRRALDPRLRDAHPRAFFEKRLRPLPAGAVIFDLDGTLVDSERIAAPVCVEVLREAGFDIDVASFEARCTGMTDPAIVAMLADEAGIEVDHAAVVERIEARCLERMAAAELAMPDVATVVRRLERPLAVASNSTPPHIRLCLERSGLLETFAPHLYSAAEVGEGKPAPGVFLHAAAMLGVAPNRCLVVEDSVHGILAAKAAGMTPIGFTGAYPAEHALALHAAGAETCIRHYRDLAVLLDLD